MTDTTPSIAQVIRLALEAELAEVRVSLPAKIRQYDHTSQTASVEILIKNPLDEETSEDFPVLQKVPVIFPRGTIGGWYLHVPLVQGDEGDLVFSDFPLDAWRRDGEIKAPVDLRPHSLGGAKFYPGLHSSNHTLGDASSQCITIGKDGGFKVEIGLSGAMRVDGGDYPVALGDRVKQLEAAMKSHTHPVSGTVAGVSTDLTALDITYNSSKLKVGG